LKNDTNLPETGYFLVTTMPPEGIAGAALYMDGVSMGCVLACREMTCEFALDFAVVKGATGIRSMVGRPECFITSSDMVITRERVKFTA
jgi:hypothetical protein